MEDFLKFLLIAGVILVGIFKEVNKNKAKKTANKRPAPPVPSASETANEAVPLPEAWGKMFPSQDIFQPKPVGTPNPKESQKNKNSRKQKEEPKKTYASQLGTLGEGGSSLPGKNNTQPTASTAQHEEPASENEYSIHTAEEARRAIIWGEILQRKY